MLNILLKTSVISLIMRRAGTTMTPGRRGVMSRAYSGSIAATLLFLHGFGKGAAAAENPFPKGFSLSVKKPRVRLLTLLARTARIRIAARGNHVETEQPG